MENSVTEYTTSDLSRKSGDIIAEALRSPVVITQRRKPRLVILSVEEYQRLSSARQDSRKPYRLQTMPDELFDEAKKALVAYENEP
jgi:prevent-host-death family protein